jgi:cytosine/creatinine deaminase
MPMDLKITQAQLPGRSHQWDIAIANGTISAIAPSIPGTATMTLDAQGKLVIPGLVDAHIHLDKAFLLDRVEWQTGTFTEALQETANAKRAFTVADIQTRARRVLEQAIAFGTTAMRSHVEVDPFIQLTGIKALLPLRDEYAGGSPFSLLSLLKKALPISLEPMPYCVRQWH